MVEIDFNRIVKKKRNDDDDDGIPQKDGHKDMITNAELRAKLEESRRKAGLADKEKSADDLEVDK